MSRPLQDNEDPLRWLADGALMPNSQRRGERVQRMAADLIRYDAYGNREDAVRSLFGRGYSIFEIGLLVDDARQAAFQQTVDVVAKEVGKP